MNTHHALSPSAWPKWLVCPAFAPDPRPGPAAIEGTRQHAALEKALRGLPNPTEGLDEDAAEAVAWAAGIIRTEAGTTPIRTEVRLTGRASDGAEYFGTADAVVGPRVYDYKSGREGDYAAQLAAYALAALQGDPLAETYEAIILFGGSRSIVRQTYTVEEAQAVAAKVIEARTNPDRKPARCQYCQWCADRVRCPEVTTDVAALVPDRIKDLAAVLADVEAIRDPPTLAKALDLAETVKTWAEAAKAHANRLALDEGIIPDGYAIRSRASAPTIKDGPAAFALLEKAKLPTVARAAVKLSWKELTKAHAEAAKCTENEAGKFLATVLAGMVETKQPSRFIQKTR